MTLPGEDSNLYESPKLLGEYLLLHYGGELELLYPGLPVNPAVTSVPFPVRCVRELLDPARLPADARALEVGCSVGGAAFELTRYCNRVEAVDYSRSFIAAAQTLQRDGQLIAARTIEGSISIPFVAQVPAELNRSRATFSVADATKLPSSLVSFDVVLAANLICRLPNPDIFLSRTASLVKPGGQLLLTTPFTWLEDYTPCDRWIGGIHPEARSEQELTRHLEGGEGRFRLHRRRDLSFLIREHERKYQLGIALGTCWIRS